MDSTLRSNLAHGMPIDIAVVRRDRCAVDLHHWVVEGDAYFEDLRQRWSIALLEAQRSIPRPPYPANGHDDRGDDAP
jgi:putative proteasome-type protease